jgi:hypothetical protein
VSKLTDGLAGKQVCHHEVAHGKLMGQVSIAFKKLVDGTNYLAVHAPGSKTLVGQVRCARRPTHKSCSNSVCNVRCHSIADVRVSGDAQVVLQVAKAPLVNQYARLRSDFLSYHKGSNTAKPVLAYHKTKVLHAPSGSFHLLVTPVAPEHVSVPDALLQVF